ncbi:MAG: hypothetical protein QMD66_07710 [Actinomycetota bacterium]|nr:hypothetical protein [Actinomycetota bacterium]MDI6822712.1 hypothetical protein [Actinomycetota bacterium]
MIKCQLNTDCEGPISLNDNALELTCHFIPQGMKFFSQVSGYDDYLADIAKRPGYKAGDTLRLISPFLKAYGATNLKIERYSEANLSLVPGAKEILQFIRQRIPIFIVSTSYEPYIRVLCRLLDFPLENVYCTKLDIDGYEIEERETKRLKELVEEIVAMPPLEMSSDVQYLQDLSLETQKIIARLDDIFWREMASMKCGRLLKEINPVGGWEKAQAVLDSLAKTGNSLSEVIYVGDSITDVEALDLVRRNGGLAISFNGNRYSLKAAEIACISGHVIVIAILTCAFSKGGKEKTLWLVRNWNHSAIRQSGVNDLLMDELISLYPSTLPRVEIITDSNRNEIIDESETFRRRLRGGAGRLG